MPETKSACIYRSTYECRGFERIDKKKNRQELERDRVEAKIRDEKIDMIITGRKMSQVQYSDIVVSPAPHTV